MQKKNKSVKLKKINQILKSNQSNLKKTEISQIQVLYNFFRICQPSTMSSSMYTPPSPVPYLLNPLVQGPPFDSVIARPILRPREGVEPFPYTSTLGSPYPSLTPDDDTPNDDKLDGTIDLFLVKRSLKRALEAVPEPPLKVPCPPPVSPVEPVPESFERFIESPPSPLPQPFQFPPGHFDPKPEDADTLDRLKLTLEDLRGQTRAEVQKVKLASEARRVELMELVGYPHHIERQLEAELLLIQFCDSLLDKAA